MRTLIFYHYFEKNAAYTDNLLHFLRFGYDREADFVIVVSGSHSVAIPKFDNLRCIEVENRNFDYGGYAAAIAATPNLDAYDAFVFVNSSMRGPYMPAYAKGPWHRYFTDQFGDDVGLVGAAINECTSTEAQVYREKYGGSGPCVHVQSTAYAMPAATMRMLLASGFYDDKRVLEKMEVIRDYELRLSQLVLQSGLNLKCLLPEYNLVDYRTGATCANEAARGGDPSWPFGYFGRSAHPFEIMFVKTERRLFSMAYLDLLSASMNARSVPLDEDAITPDMNRYLKRLDECRHSGETIFAEMRVCQVCKQLKEARRWVKQRAKSAVRSLTARRTS
jgi:hypothetical protein